MAQTAQSHNKQLDTSDSVDTYYAWVTGGGASTQTLIQKMVIINNDAISQTVTIGLQTYSGGYSTVLEMSYTIAAGDSEFPVEFTKQVLNGDASNPDRIVAKFSDALGASDTIDCQASSVLFA